MISYPKYAGVNLAAALLTTVGGAYAETAPPMPTCAFDTAPHLGGEVPANLPAIAVKDTSGPGFVLTLGAPTDSHDPTLTFTVTDDSRQLGTKLLRPSANFAVGARVVDLGPKCDGGALGANASVNFIAAAAQPLPTTAGEVTVAPPGARGVTQLAFKPSAELKAYLNVVRVEITNGSNSLSRDYGNVPSVFYFASGDGDSNQLNLCQGVEPSQKRHLDFHFHVAGAMTDPPALTIDADIDCRAAAAPPPSYPDDAGVDAPGATSAANTGGSGCTVGLGGSSALPVGGLIGFATLIAARARSARRRRSVSK